MDKIISWTTVKKPSYFLVGAPKCGTTSFYNYFNLHPELYVSPIKEPNFFANDLNPDSFSKAYKKTYLHNLPAYFKQRPLPQAHLAFVQKEEDYKKLFIPNIQNLKAGECSSSYLYSAAAPQKIKAFNAHSKIIISLRNPIERAYSHYQMAVQMGLVTASFKTAFLADKNLSKGQFGQDELFFELGLYAEGIKKYQEIFGPENVLVVFFEDWIKNAAQVQEKVCQFLNVAIFAPPNLSESNVSKSVRNTVLHQKLKQGLAKKIWDSFGSEIVKEKVKNLYYKSKKQSLNNTDKQMLLDFYKADINATAQLLQVDLSNWLKV